MKPDVAIINNKGMDLILFKYFLRKMSLINLINLRYLLIIMMFLLETPLYDMLGKITNSDLLQGFH